MKYVQEIRCRAEQCGLTVCGIVAVARQARRWSLVAVALGALIALPARAGQLSLLINGKAIHLEERAGVDFNEENWGAGLHYDFTGENKKWVPFLTASGFKDSNNNPSYYAGGGTMRRFYFGDANDKNSLHVGAGVVAFLMVREDFENGDPFPGVLPVATVGNDRFALNVTYIPKVDPKMVPILFFQIRVGLH